MAIIVNADDFGLSSSVNAAIVESFRRGWISSTTLMANMPAFDEAVALAKQHRLDGRIGVHLNLTEGTALTGPIRQCRRLCDPDGNLLSRPRDLFIASKTEISAIRTELRAQLRACLDAGLVPSHLDSHHHVHTSWAVGRVVIALAQEFGVPFVRVAHNAGGRISRKHLLYSAVFNRQLRARGLAGVRYFCSIRSATPTLLQAEGGVELMVHPMMQPDGRVTEFGDKDDLGSMVERLFLQERPVSYGELATLARG